MGLSSFESAQVLTAGVERTCPGLLPAGALHAPPQPGGLLGLSLSAKHMWGQSLTSGPGEGHPQARLALIPCLL